jgi:hypothetical protein
MSDVPAGLTPGSTIRFVQDAPAAHALASGAVVSPDGRHLAFVARRRDNGRPELWVRSLDAPQARAVPGTEGAFRPFWSPDSQALGFFAEGRLKRVGLGNQPPQTLADVGYRPSGGSWSSSGIILFSERQSRLYAVAESGGKKSAVTSLEDGHDVAHQTPFFLPNGREFLYFVIGSAPETSGTYLGSLDSRERVRLLDSSAAAVSFAEPGYLLYVRDGNMMAHRFDGARRRVEGAPQPIASTRTEPMAEIRAGTISASSTALQLCDPISEVCVNVEPLSIHSRRWRWVSSMTACPPRSVCQITASRSGAVTGSGRSKTVLTALKMALFDPMATAKVRTVATVKPGACRK